MTLRERYQANYDRISHDHLVQWRKDGTNPFMPDAVVERSDELTAAIVRQYVPGGARLLDAGVGIGNVLNRLTEYDRHGIDISAEYLEVARSRGIEVVEGDIEAMPYDDATFDGVLALDVLEHVLDLHRACLELVRVTKPDGTIVVRTPYRENLEIYVGYTDYEFVHLRRFDEPTFTLLFQRVYGCQSVTTQVIPYPMENRTSAMGEIVAVVRR